MINAQDWSVCTPGPQVLEGVVESPLITYQPTGDHTRTTQIHAGSCTNIKMLIYQLHNANMQYVKLGC